MNIILYTHNFVFLLLVIILVIVAFRTVILCVYEITFHKKSLISALDLDGMILL